MMTLTREDVEKLSAPLPLEAGHEVRVAETFSQNTKARWLVYTTEDPVRDRLTEVDPGWQLRNAQIVISGDSATVSQEMVVCDAARTGVGGASVKREEDTLDHDVIKAAATDSIKRAARLFGVGAYLLDAPRIVTDWKPGKLDWRERQEYEKQAFAQFARWYKQRFGNDTRAIDGDTGEVTRSEAQPTTRAQRSTHNPPKPSVADELPPAAQEMAHWTTESGAINKMVAWAREQVWDGIELPHARNRVAKALGVTNFASIAAEYRGTKQEAMAAIEAYVPSDEREGAPAEQPQLVEAPVPADTPQKRKRAS
jgi:hypothetical protein